MFGKIFTQIFDSSLADNPQTRWVFMDLLVLADQNGVVDMTREAISRRTNVPLKIVITAIKELESEDNRSRSNDFKGVRLKRLDEHRDWGWVIVNYPKYRAIANAEAYRQVTREKVQAIRERERKSPPAPPQLKEEAKAKAEAGNSLHVITRNNRPSLEEVKLVIAKTGLPESDAIWFWNKCEGNGWTNGGKAIKSWTHTIVAWKAAGYMASQKQNSNPNSDFWQRTKELEIVEKELKNITERASHTAFGMTIEPKDKPAYDRLVARKKELKTQLHLK